MEQDNTNNTGTNSQDKVVAISEDLQVFANLILDKILEDQLRNKRLFAKNNSN